MQEIRLQKYLSKGMMTKWFKIYDVELIGRNAHNRQILVLKIKNWNIRRESEKLSFNMPRYNYLLVTQSTLTISHQ